MCAEIFLKNIYIMGILQKFKVLRILESLLSWGRGLGD